MTKFNQLAKKILKEDMEVVPRRKMKKPVYGLKVDGVVYQEGDIMDECPFEGTLDATLLNITPIKGGFEFDIMADGEGYTYTTADIAEMGINAKVVKFK